MSGSSFVQALVMWPLRLALGGIVIAAAVINNAI